MTATSTTHSELISAFEASLLHTPLQDQVTEVLQHLPLQAILFMDNKAAISMASNNVLTNQNRHFLTKFYYLHELIENDVLSIQYINTHDQVADGFSKALSEDLHVTFLANLVMEGS